MPTLNVNRVNVHFAETGIGEAVVLVPSGALSGDQWQEVSGRLKDSYRLLAIDLYGMGGTDPWSGTSDPQLDDEAALVMALISTCDKPVHLVGHSHGGDVALRVAITSQGRLRSLTLIEPWLLLLLQQSGEDNLYAEAKGVLVPIFLPPYNVVLRRKLGN